MRFNEIATYKETLDKALRAFNENIYTRIYLTIDDKHFAFRWFDTIAVEKEIIERCGEEVLNAIKQIDFDFGLTSWHTSTITYFTLENGTDIKVSSQISID